MRVTKTAMRRGRLGRLSGHAAEIRRPHAPFKINHFLSQGRWITASRQAWADRQAEWDRQEAEENAQRAASAAR